MPDQESCLSQCAQKCAKVPGHIIDDSDVFYKIIRIIFTNLIVVAFVCFYELFRVDNANDEIQDISETEEDDGIPEEVFEDADDFNIRNEHEIERNTDSPGVFGVGESLNNIHENDQ